MPVSAELRRKDAQGNVVDYVLVDDAENTETLLSDPTIDFGARSRLETVIERLEDILDQIGGGLVVGDANQLVPQQYDAMNMTYTGDELTEVVYRLDGTVVATLTLGYTDGRLTSVART